MSGHLDLLGRGQPLEDLLTTARSKGLELMQLLGDINLRIPGQLTDLLNLFFQLHQGFFKFQQGATCHESFGELSGHCGLEIGIKVQC